jgi:hypothetical protein
MGEEHSPKQGMRTEMENTLDDGARSSSSDQSLSVDIPTIELKFVDIYIYII